MDQVASDPIDDVLVDFSRRSFLSERDVYQYFVDAAVMVIEAEIGYLHLYDEGTENISLGVWSGKVFDQCKTTHVSHYALKEAGIWADSVRRRNSIIHNDYLNLHNRTSLPEGHFPIRNHLGCPVFDSKLESIVGIIGVGNREADFVAKDASRLEQFVMLTWPVLVDKLSEIDAYYSDRALLFRKRDPQALLSEMIATMGRALELRDEYTNMHQSNVALLCDRIAERLELPEQQRFGLKLGASIHDIGKIAGPSEILTKPGGLMPAEFELVKTHAEMGAKLFEGHELPWPIQEMVAQHHERIDGSGYPKGLLGQSICVEARIIAVADTFDAMSSDRPYRFAPGPQLALEVFREQRGITFDTYIVDIFLELIEQDEEIRSRYGV